MALFNVNLCSTVLMFVANHYSGPLVLRTSGEGIYINAKNALKSMEKHVQYMLSCMPRCNICLVFNKQKESISEVCYTEVC